MHRTLCQVPEGAGRGAFFGAKDTELGDPLVLFADIDGTLLPYRNASEAEPGSQRRALLDLHSLCIERSVVLVYNTGRDLAWVRECIVNDTLPKPHAAICGQGCTVFSRYGWEERWTDLLTSKGFNLAQIDEQLREHQSRIRET